MNQFEIVNINKIYNKNNKNLYKLKYNNNL